MANEPPKPPSGRGLTEAIRNYAVLVILVIVIQIALVFFIIRTLIIGRREDAGEAALLALKELQPEEEEVVVPDKPARIYELKDDLLTNSADVDRLRFVKVRVQIGVTPEKVYDEIAQIEPKVIDTILGVLMSKTVEEMDDPADKEVIKDEIKIALNKFIHQGDVVKVYLTAFLIQ